MVIDSLIMLESCGDLILQEERQYITYILRCADDTLYTGWTTDIVQRINAHNSGAGAKYTRSRGPVQLLARWFFESKSEAMQMEYAIKQMPRTQKLRLVAENKL